MKKQGKNIVYGKAVRPNAGRESCIKKSQQKPHVVREDPSRSSASPHSIAKKA
mgnify:CR=1 FL=1